MYVFLFLSPSKDETGILEYSLYQKIVKSSAY